MAIKITNTSVKVIGIGNVTVLPGETKEVPVDFQTSPILDVYKNMGLVSISGKATNTSSIKSDMEKIKSATDEADKKAKLERLESSTDEEIAALAVELGINPADCKDQKDVIKKVKAELNK